MVGREFFIYTLGVAKILAPTGYESVTPTEMPSGAYCVASIIGRTSAITNKNQLNF